MKRIKQLLRFVSDLGTLVVLVAAAYFAFFGGPLVSRGVYAFSLLMWVAWSVLHELNERAHEKQVAELTKDIEVLSTLLTETEESAAYWKQLVMRRLP